MQISKLRGPIGLYIGSKTPSEIAMSILAEMTAVKNGVALLPEMQVQEAKNHVQVPASDAVCGIDRERA